MASATAFHRAYPRATQQAFLEAHELAFRYFGGVFRLCRYDNLKSAVKAILRGKRREEAARFIAFRSHGHFEVDFCTPGAGHEKGGVEGEQGYFRRNHWVPVPQAEHLQALTAQVLTACRQDEGRWPSNASTCCRSPRRGWISPRSASRSSTARARVKVRMNGYSVPVRAGTVPSICRRNFLNSMFRCLG
jgi:hypothetical protein